MGIFNSIRDAIFGQKDTPAAAPAAAPEHPQTTAAEPAPEREKVDIMAVLSEKAAADGRDLNWQTSIVDLMKLLDLDSSLQARKELAAEFNYDGPLDGSADMNIRLHRAVMAALAANGGIVPPQMMD